MEMLFDDLEVNEDYMNVGHDLTASTWAQEASARFTESFTRAPLSSVGRMYEMGFAKLDEEAPYLTEDEWKESQYFRPGLKFKDGVNEEVAALTADRKDEERERQDVMERAPKGIMRAGSMFAVDMAAQLADPLNIASAYVPIVGAGRFATMVGKVGITRARLASGAIEGVVGAAIVEPVIYAASKQEQADYGMYDSLIAMGVGGVFGAGLHVGVGKMGDILGISPYATGKIKGTAIADVSRGVNPDVAPLVRAGTDTEQFRTHGARSQVWEQLAKADDFSPDEATAIFTMLDSISISAHRRGLIPDVDAFYNSILDQPGRTKKGVTGTGVFAQVEDMVTAFKRGDVPGVVRGVGKQLFQIINTKRGKDWTIFSDWINTHAGVGKSAKAMGRAVWDAKNQETFLRGFEKYLMGGEAPDKTMIPMFDTFKGILNSIYENVGDERFIKTNYKSPEVKAALKKVTEYDRKISKVRTEQIRQLQKKEDLEIGLHGEASAYRGDISQVEPHIRNEYEDAIRAVIDTLNKLDVEARKLIKESEVPNAVYKEAKARATSKIELTPEVKEAFDKLLAEELPPRTPDPRTKEELKTPKDEDPEAKAFSEKVEAEEEGAPQEWKSVEEEVTALRAGVKDLYDSGDMLETQHQRMSDTILASEENTANTKRLVRGIINCII